MRKNGSKTKRGRGLRQATVTAGEENRDYVVRGYNSNLTRSTAKPASSCWCKEKWSKVALHTIRGSGRIALCRRSGGAKSDDDGNTLDLDLWRYSRRDDGAATRRLSRTRNCWSRQWMRCGKKLASQTMNANASRRGSAQNLRRTRRSRIPHAPTTQAIVPRRST